MQDIYTKIFTSKKFWKVFIPVVLFTLISGTLFVFKNNPTEVSAGWWNDSWNYRKSVQVTNNTSEESNVYISLTLDTSATTTIQSNCGDFRFTTESGEVLKYYIVSGCGTATNVIHVNFDKFSAGLQTVYFYYGNASVDNGFEDTDFSTEASNYSIGIVGSEEVGSGPVGYWSFDEGFGSTAHDTSSGGNDGIITGATWQDESMCVSGKCLYFDGEDQTLVSADILDNMGEYTYCLWMNPKEYSNADSDAWINLIHKGGYIAFNNTSNEFGFRQTTSVAYPYAYSSSLPKLNKWVFVCSVYYGVGTSPKIYIDGISNDSSVSAGSGTQSDDSSQHLSIGGDAANTYESNFHGYIDEVKIYPYARTADQIKQDYTAGLAGINTSKGVSASFGGSSDSWMSDGLVGYWKMDETATTSGAIDSSGNGNNGTYYGTASTTGGKFGNGGVFDGDNGSGAGNGIIDISDGATSGSILDLIDNFSVFSWVKVDSAPSSGLSGACIVCKGVSSGGPSLQYGLFVDDNLKLHVSNYQNESTNSIELDKWYGMTIVYGKAGTKPSLFIDGEKWEFSGGGITPIHYNYNLTIGGVTPGTIYHPLDGIVDEVRIYNRALSESEVKKLYEWAPGPVLHLKMDEKQGTTAYDSSGYGNDGNFGGSGSGTDNPAWTRGKYGSGVIFDGDNDIVNVGNDTSLDISVGSIMAWVKPIILSDSYPRIISKENYTQGESFAFYINESSGLLHLYVDSTYIVNSNTDFRNKLNEWSHVAIIADGTTATMYINGKLENSSAFSGFPTTTYDLRIGGNSNETRMLNGSIDDVKIYNYARTQKQILEDMNGGRPASKSPIAYWKFDEGYGATVHDSSGNGNNGTASSSDSGTNTSVSQMWSLDGKYNKAMEFDGTNDFVDIGNPSDLDININISVSAWIKTSSDNNGRIISKHGSPVGNWGWLLARSSANDSFEWRLSTTGSNWLGGTSSDNSFEVNIWYHILATYNGSYMRLYINGKEDINNTFPYATTGTINIPSGSTQIARDDGTGSSNVFNGKIDEVKIFNYALSEDEIKQEYNQGKAAVFGSTGRDASGNKDNSSSREYCVPGDTGTCDPPVLELNMDEKEGTTAHDTSGNGNDGTITGASWSRGKIGSGLDFDGINDYVEVGNDSSLNITDSLTINAWINSSNKGGTLLGSNNGSFSQGYWVGWESNDNLYLYLDGVYDWTITDGLLRDGWHYYSFLYSGSEMLAYRDGVFLSSTIQSGTIINNGTINVGIIGAYKADGKIDDLKIYNYARTPAQIAWDYNKGKPIAEWRFDECQGSVAHDQTLSTGSGQGGNDGTITIGSSGTQTELGNCSSSTTVSAWYNGRNGKINKSLNFDGTDDYIDVGDVGLNINAISFWMKQDYSDNYFIDLDGGTSTISLVSLVVTTTGFTSPIIYIDGEEKTEIPDNAWHQITIVTNTSIDVNNLNIGKIGTDYYEGLFDEIKLYNYPLTSEQVKIGHNNGAVRF